jgi:hypothetical protein
VQSVIPLCVAGKVTLLMTTKTNEFKVLGVELHTSVNSPK